MAPFVKMAMPDDGLERVPEEQDGSAVELLDVVKLLELSRIPEKCYYYLFLLPYLRLVCH